MPSPHRSSLPLRIVLSIILVFFGLLAARGLREVWRAVQSPGWPKVSGVVTTASTRTSGIYSPMLEVTYKVGAEVFQTQRIAFGIPSGTGTAMEAELQRYRFPLGAELPVYHHPADPSLAVLQPGWRLRTFWQAFLCLLFVAPALYYFVRAPREPLEPLLVYVAWGLTWAGALILASQGRQMWQAWRAQSWPLVSGQVVYLNHGGGVQRLEPVAEDPQSRRRAWGVIYRYEVDGVTYHDASIRLGQTVTGDEETLSELGLSLAHPVWVRVSPGRPPLALLQPGLTGDSFIIVGLGVVLLFFGLLIWRFAWPALRGE